MLGSEKRMMKEERNGKAGSAEEAEQKMTLKWTYNYFSVESENSSSDWRENLPYVVRKALRDET